MLQHRRIVSSNGVLLLLLSSTAGVRASRILTGKAGSKAKTMISGEEWPGPASIMQDSAVTSSTAKDILAERQLISPREEAYNGKHQDEAEVDGKQVRDWSGGWDSPPTAHDDEEVGKNPFLKNARSQYKASAAQPDSDDEEEEISPTGTGAEIRRDISATEIVPGYKSPPGTPTLIHQASQTHSDEFYVSPAKGKMVLLIAGIVTLITFVLLVGYAFNRCIAKDPAVKKAVRHGLSGSGESATSTFRDRAPVCADRKAYIHDGHKVFEWEQSENIIKLYIDVPEGVTKTDLDIKIGRHHLQIGCNGKPPFMRDELYEAINEHESFWRLRTNGELQIKLQKEETLDWEHVLK